MNNQTLPEMVWHYSKLDFLDSIEASGELQPRSEAESQPHAKKSGFKVSQTPLIWFSSDQQWEALCVQTCAGLNKRGVTWQMLAEEQTAIRFGISPNDPRLLDWKATCNASYSNRKERRNMENLAIHAKKAGSDATKWFTSPVPIPLKDLRLQVWVFGSWGDHAL